MPDRIAADRIGAKTYLTAGACGLFIIAALTIAGVSLINRFHATNVRAARQKDINRAVCTSVINLDREIIATLRLFGTTHQLKQAEALFKPPAACTTALQGGKP